MGLGWALRDKVQVDLGLHTYTWGTIVWCTLQIRQYFDGYVCHDDLRNLNANSVPGSFLFIHYPIFSWYQHAFLLFLSSSNIWWLSEPKDDSNPQVCTNLSLEFWFLVGNKPSAVAIPRFSTIAYSKVKQQQGIDPKSHMEDIHVLLRFA